jgi:hypothetical protein
LAETPAALNATGKSGDSIAKYRLFVPTRSKAEIRTRVQTVAQAITLTNVSISKAADIGTTWSKPLNGSALDVWYDAESDVLQINDTAALGSREVTLGGEQAAKDEMKRFVHDLASAGLIKEGQYDLASAVTGHHKRMMGNRETKEVAQRVVEYRYFIPRKLNGIEVANAAIMIGIAPSGKRSSIRIGGVEVDSIQDGVEERPSATGGVSTRTVSATELDSKFSAHVAKGRPTHTSFKGVMYMLPPGAKDAVVEPKMVYSYTTSQESPDGSKAIEDITVVSFSLTDRNALHEVFDGSRPRTQAPAHAPTHK